MDNLREVDYPFPDNQIKINIYQFSFLRRDRNNSGRRRFAFTKKVLIVNTVEVGHFELAWDQYLFSK